MWTMAKKYGHFNDENLRKAVHAISKGTLHQFPHQSNFPTRLRTA
jgi:hypothetical protein